MKRYIIALLVVAIVVISTIGFLGYGLAQKRQALRNIQISVDEIRLIGLNSTIATLDISLRFTNPGTDPAVLDRTDYTLYINNIEVGSGQNLEKATIPAGGSEVIPQLFNISYSGGLQTIWSLIKEGGADWRLVGTAYFDTYLGTIGVPYDQTGTIVL